MTYLIWGVLGAGLDVVGRGHGRGGDGLDKILILNSTNSYRLLTCK